MRNVATARTKEEALLLQEVLQNEGVDAQIAPGGELLPGLPAQGGYKVRVADEDFDRAAEVIEGGVGGQAEDEGEGEGPSLEEEIDRRDSIPLGEDGKAFRALVVLSLVLSIALNTASYKLYESIPKETLDLLDSWSVSEPVQEELPSLYLAANFFEILASIGLLCFLKFARPLYLGTVVFYCLAGFFLGGSISHGYVGAIGNLAAVASGAVIALAYASPVSRYFGKVVVKGRLAQQAS